MTGGGDDFASPYQAFYDWTTGTGLRARRPSPR